nr:Putative uncharacterized protein [Moritella viscosa]
MTLYSYNYIESANYISRKYLVVQQSWSVRFKFTNIIDNGSHYQYNTHLI